MTVLRKLWQGHYSLPLSFWVFYLGGYLTCVGLTFIVSPFFTTQPWRLLSVLVLTVPYNIVSTAGTLRSADASPQESWWPILTKIVVCLWEARVVWSLTSGTLRALREF